MKIYIAMPISGLDYAEVTRKADLAEKFLTEKGLEVYNPLKICPFVEGKTWDEYMAELLPKVSECDAIYMMNGWLDSRGARIEFIKAIKEKKLIILQKIQPI